MSNENSDNLFLQLFILHLRANVDQLLMSKFWILVVDLSYLYEIQYDVFQFYVMCFKVLILFYMLTLQAPTWQNGQTETILLLLPTNCLSMFEYFVVLVLKGLTINIQVIWEDLTAHTSYNHTRNFNLRICAAYLNPLKTNIII